MHGRAWLGVEEVISKGGGMRGVKETAIETMSERVKDEWMRGPKASREDVAVFAAEEKWRSLSRGIASPHQDHYPLPIHPTLPLHLLCVATAVATHLLTRTAKSSARLVLAAVTMLGWPGF